MNSISHVTDFYENYNTLSIPKLHSYRIMSLVDKLLTITANYLLYFQHNVMIINYFMNIILMGKNCFT